MRGCSPPPPPPPPPSLLGETARGGCMLMTCCDEKEPEGEAGPEEGALPPLPIEGSRPSLTSDCCLNEPITGREPNGMSIAADGLAKDEVGTMLLLLFGCCLGKESLLSTNPERDLTLLMGPTEEE